MNTLPLSHFYSAEMTSLLRCAYPKISQDTISECFVGADGARLTQEFLLHFDYFLMARLISVRAGFFLKEAIRLLYTGRYDACISIASGFSLLTYLIQQKIDNDTLPFIDCDLEYMIDERKRRLSRFPIQLSCANSMMNFDLIEMFKNKQSMKEIFPQYKSPLFIVEGLSYFVTKPLFFYLLHDISLYQKSAILFDVCDKNLGENSVCLNNILKKMPGYLCQGEAMYDENEKSWKNIKECFDLFNGCSILEAEQTLISGLDGPLLVDNTKFVPTNLVVAEQIK